MTYCEIATKLRDIADELEKRGKNRSLSTSFLLVCQSGIPSLSAFLISTDTANQTGKIEETIFV